MGMLLVPPESLPTEAGSGGSARSLTSSTQHEQQGTLNLSRVPWVTTRGVSITIHVTISLHPGVVRLPPYA